MTPTLLIGLGSALLATTAVLGLWIGARRAHSARHRVEGQLESSRRDVAQLADEVSRLAAEVEARGRRPVDEREYVITTLAEATEVTTTARSESRGGGALAETLQQRALARLAAVDTSTKMGARVADAGVKTLALAHGLRRALTQENLDRAAAEAHVARRRSRRTRRQELREARRLLRAVRAQQPARVTGTGSEDAA